MKRILIILNVLVLLYLFYQSNHTNTSSSSKNTFRIIKEPDMIEEFKTQDVKENTTQENTLLDRVSSEILKENHIVNLDNPILVPPKWLQNVQNLTGQILPDSLTTLIKDFYCGEPTATYFELMEVNLDEDSKKEKILFFYFGCSMASRAITLFLDQIQVDWYHEDRKQDDWYIKVVIDHISRYTLEKMKPEYIPTGQIVVCKSGYSGGGSGGGYNHFYKNVHGHWQEVLTHQYELFKSLPDITHYTTTTYEVISEKEIIISFYSIAYQEDFKPEEILHTVDDKKYIMYLNWDAYENIYRPERPQEEDLLMEIDAFGFRGP